MQMGMRLRRTGLMDVVGNTHQAGSLQKSYVVQNLKRRSLTGNVAAFEHITAIRNIFKRVQIVRGRDYRLRTVFPGDQKINNLRLARRIERRTGLVQKKDLGISNQD